jgi:spore coat polysaccharide biosynthesis protein SpsF (cytidylyltransferase family)
MTEYPSDVVVRITADCPFIDPQIVGEALRLHRHERADYTSNTLVRTYPDGLDVEVIRASVLHVAAREAQQADEREHVTPFVYRQPHRFAIRQLTSGNARLGRERWTLDNADDFELLSEIAARVPVVAEASWLDLLEAAGTSAVFDDVDVIPDLAHVTDVTTRRWLVMSADEVIGHAAVAVGAEVAVLTLDCDPAVRSAARRAVERALQADLQISNLVEDDG